MRSYLILLWIFKMINRYSITIYTPQEYNHSSYIQTGLFELEKQGILDIDIKLSLQHRKGKYRIESDSLIKTNEYSPKTLESFI